MAPPPIPPFVQTIESVPILRMLPRIWYDKRFSGNCFGCFRGVFHSFSEAYKSAPKTKPHGFNTPAYAAEYRDRRSAIFSFDYPVLLWLKSLMREGTRIFDFGGHLGTHFYAYAKYIQYPPGLSWTVCDLPEMTKAGQILALERGVSGLSFTNEFGDAEGADILIAAGSIQYVEAPTFAAKLSELKRKPDHVLMNKVPLYDGPQYVTLQNGGVAFHPQYVFNRQEFIDSIRAVDYELIDAWSVDSHPCYIPFHPERSFSSHTGLYLRRKGAHERPSMSRGNVND